MSAQPSGSGATPAAWTAAIIVIAISLLSSFTLSDPDGTRVAAGADNAGASTEQLYIDGTGEEVVLGEGESLAVDAEGNQVVVNAKGEVVRKLGTAASSTAGSAGTSSATRKAGTTGGPPGG